MIRRAFFKTISAIAGLLLCPKRRSANCVNVEGTFEIEADPETTISVWFNPVTKELVVKED